jgi:hypothetical protein
MHSVSVSDEPERQGSASTSVPADPAASTAISTPVVNVVGSFTVDPLVEPLSFLLAQSGLSLNVNVASYGQIFQQLLDPAGLFARNRGGRKRDPAPVRRLAPGPVR